MWPLFPVPASLTSGLSLLGAAGLLAVLLTVVSAADPFDLADKNHDGHIDHSEFQQWTKAIRDAIVPFLGDFDISGEVAGVGVGVGAPSQKESHGPASSVMAKTTAFWTAFVNSLITIWATEIGDKTFFIAAIMAMRNPRLLVFAGAIGALVVMTVLSVVMGSILSLLPRTYTHYAGAAMFLYFGARMLKDAQGMEGNKPSEELAEVEEELNAKKGEEQLATMEDGGGPVLGSLKTQKQIQVFTQAFSLTFLAEWGDRSQVATIALSAIRDAVGVTLGAIIGHAMCTGLAVVGGRLLAARISEKQVAIAGGVLFLLFGLHSLVVGPESQ